ncbi:hypothetical protein XENOCAPTIV_017011 [Xenoophorus captivus]|uniref:Uncharacterized protein n=1 Tax=Xenoophorus captivus TaxID=1517983 RepID=A0ABV0RMP9_9TELE
MHNCIKLLRSDRQSFSQHAQGIGQVYSIKWLVSVCNTASFNGCILVFNNPRDDGRLLFSVECQSMRVFFKGQGLCLKIFLNSPFSVSVFSICCYLFPHTCI